jgi:hypothetical protein
MKKLIATIALGTFVFTSTLVTTSFAADNETAETVKASTTAENTAIKTATSAADADLEEMAPVIVIGAAAIGGAAIVLSNDSDGGHVAHGHGH